MVKNGDGGGGTGSSSSAGFVCECVLSSRVSFFFLTLQKSVMLCVYGYGLWICVSGGSKRKKKKNE